MQEILTSTKFSISAISSVSRISFKSTELVN